MKKIVKQITILSLFYILCVGITDVIQATQISVDISMHQSENVSDKILAHFCDFYVQNDSSSWGNLYYEIREYDTLDTENFYNGVVLVNGIVTPGNYQGTVNLGGNFMQYTVNENLVAIRLARQVDNMMHWVVGGAILSNDDPLLRSSNIMSIEALQERIDVLREEALTYIEEHPEEFYQ